MIIYNNYVNINIPDDTTNICINIGYTNKPILSNYCILTNISTIILGCVLKSLYGKFCTFYEEPSKYVLIVNNILYEDRLMRETFETFVSFLYINVFKKDTCDALLYSMKKSFKHDIVV